MVSLSERPTTPPSFDLGEYARDSETRWATASWRPPSEWEDELPTVARRPASNVTTIKQLSVAISDEEWAESMPGPPIVTMTADAIMGLPIDHRAGFLLSLIDGQTDLETLLALSPIPRMDALRIMRELFESDAIRFGR
jgi:hypothetical protein